MGFVLLEHKSLQEKNQFTLLKNILAWILYEKGISSDYKSINARNSKQRELSMCFQRVSLRSNTPYFLSCVILPEMRTPLWTFSDAY